MLDGLDAVAIFAHDNCVSRRNPIGTFWPSALQGRLLVVALSEPGAGAAAWDELRARFSLDALEGGTYALLPMVYRTLVAANVDDPLLPRLKGICRKTWVTNSLLGRRTRETAEALAGSGVPAFFLEGVVLAARFYPELGLRPSSHVDVLVDEEHEAAAQAALSCAGWSEPDGSTPIGGDVRRLVDPDGTVCLLRTRLAIDFVAGQDSPHAPPWDTLERHDLDGVELYVPTATDLLLALCVLHARAEDAPNVQWIVDAKMVLAEAIDWDRIAETGRQCGQVLRLRDALGFLAGLPGPVPPQSVLDTLARTRTSRRERWTQRLTARSPGSAGGLPRLVAEHLSATAGASSLRTVATFPGHLRARWGLARRRHVLPAAGRRAIRRLGLRRKEAG
jgi:hypothetical protein